MSNLNSTGLTRVLTYIKAFVNGLLSGKANTSHTHSDYIPNSGTTSITGTGFFKSTSDSQLQIGSGTSTTTGGCFIAYGSEYSNSELAGSFRLRARTTTNYDLIGYANGSLTWGSKEIDTIEEQGNEYIRYSNGIQICWGVGVYDDGQVVSYAKAFSSNPSIVASMKANPINWRPEHFTMNEVASGHNCVSWQAIGKWK